MLAVYLHDSPEALRIQLIGDLTAPGVPLVESAWRTSGAPAVVFDLSEVERIDAEGERLLARAGGAGASFITASADADRIAKQISLTAPRTLPQPTRTAGETLRCWLTRKFRIRPTLHKCLRCGCVLRKLWAASSGRSPA